MTDLNEKAMLAAEKAYNDWCDDNEERAMQPYCNEVPLRCAITAYLEALPVVSLEECKEEVAACFTDWNTMTAKKPTPEELAKAVLQAAGVKYREG